jgi:ABC-type transport system involved in multi-copper enzyme maturation permease subunit
MIILPVAWLLPQDATILTEQSSLNELIGIVHIFFTYLTVLPFLVIYSSASLISEEIKMGTMLLLVSKPISRGEIMWGKYIALLFYNLTISVLSLGIVCLIAFLKHPFYDIIPFFWTQFLFSLIVIAFFGTLTMGLSMVFRNAKTTAVIPLMLLLVMTFLFFIVRPFLMMPSPNGDLYYETFQVYNYDLGYHFMNIYVWFYENFFSHLPEGTIRWLVSWGIYTIEYDEFSPEFEIYTKTHYQPPHISLLIILIFTVIIIIIGFIIYKRRDIF